MAPHLQKLSRALTAAATGRIDRLIVEMPPRHGKSELTSKYFPPWYLGTFPDRHVILTSATDNLAASFSGDVRDVMREVGPEFFATGLRPDFTARSLFKLPQGGSLRAAGVGTGIVGRGADLFLIDDYFKDVEAALSETMRKKIYEWYLSVARTRLSPTGAIVIVATRWHPDDLIGRVLKDRQFGGDQWEVIRFPALAEHNDPLGRKPGDALWEERYSKEWLEQTKGVYHAGGYPWMWEALYQQSPPATLDCEFDASYFDDSIWYDKAEKPADIVLRFMAVDPSLGKSDKSDFSAIIFGELDQRGHMWIDADIKRRDASQLASHIVDNAIWFKPNGLEVEANQFQTLLASDIEKESQSRGYPIPINAIISLAPKEVRIRGLAAFLKRHEFHFLRGSPGCALLVEQLKGFPSHKYKDGPDALAMLVEGFRRTLYGAARNGTQVSVVRA